MNLYISRQGQTLGPFSEEQVRQRLSAGALSPDDLACPEGSQQWMPMRQILPPGADQSPPPLPVTPPPARAGRRWWPWLVVGSVLVLLPVGAVGGGYLLLAGKLTGNVSKEVEGPSGRPVYRPVGATVYLYKKDGNSSPLPAIRRKIREMKAYIEANQGHIDALKLVAMEAELPGRFRSTSTTSTGNFIVEIDRTGRYDVVVWDHATVNGTTMTNVWFQETAGLKLWGLSEHVELDHDDRTLLDD